MKSLTSVLVHRYAVAATLLAATIGCAQATQATSRVKEGQTRSPGYADSVLAICDTRAIVRNRSSLTISVRWRSRGSEGVAGRASLRGRDSLRNEPYTVLVIDRLPADVASEIVVGERVVAHNPAELAACSVPLPRTAPDIRPDDYLSLRPLAGPTYGNVFPGVLRAVPNENSVSAQVDSVIVREGLSLIGGVPSEGRRGTFILWVPNDPDGSVAAATRDRLLATGLFSFVLLVPRSL